jgi:signal transduction histidine kinase
MKVADPTGNDKSAQMERRNAASPKAMFVRQASHDIQGSFFGVTSICCMLKLAIENREDPVVLLDHLMDACQVYKYKLSNFLEYSRFDAGLRDTIPEPVNIRYLLSRVINELEHVATEKKVKIDLSVADDVPVEIRTDEFRVAQIAANLLDNAINFSPPGSPVFFQVKKEKDRDWAMVVEDRGEGMTADGLDSVFKLLPKERNALKNPGGLGLLVTRYLAEDVLGGKISLSSQSGIGTRCQVILPLH